MAVFVSAEKYTDFRQEGAVQLITVRRLRFRVVSCRQFYHEKLGRPSLARGMYFRAMLIGFFEGTESERGIEWRVADSLCLRQFLPFRSPIRGRPNIDAGGELSFVY
jgi:hypothetical protein